MMRFGPLFLVGLSVTLLSGSALSAPVGPYSSERQIVAELNQAREERRQLSQQLGAVTTKLEGQIIQLETDLNESRRSSRTTAVVLDTRLLALTKLFQLTVTLVTGFGLAVLGYLLFLSWSMTRFPEKPAVTGRKAEMKAEPSIEELARRPFDDIPRPASGEWPT